MNNEPVAYGMLTFCKNCGEQNPYEVKELTDEEIDYCWNHSHGNTPWMKQKAFARAILRKTQEK